jgi:carbon storage regulator
MLILTRYAKEKIIIGDNEIIIKVVRVEGKKVILGIEAPANMPVHREEIYDLIQKKKQEEENS